MAKKVAVFRKRPTQLFLSFTGGVLLLVFLIVHTVKDLQAEVDAWYFHSTWVWLLVLGLASLIFLWKYRQLKKKGIEVKATFKELPEE